VMADLRARARAGRGGEGERSSPAHPRSPVRRSEEAAPVDPQHQRLLVLLDGAGLIERRRTVRAEHRDESRAQPEAWPAASVTRQTPERRAPQVSR